MYKQQCQTILRPYETLIEKYKRTHIHNLQSISAIRISNILLNLIMNLRSNETHKTQIQLIEPVEAIKSIYQ